MSVLRRITNLITHHRTLSFLLGILLIAIFSVTQLVLRRLEGVVSEPVRRGKIVDAVYGIGTVTAVRSYAIKPGIVSTIRDLYVREGDFVSKGTKLLRLDSVIYDAPFAGVVNFLPFKGGENVFAQMPTLVLTDLKSRYLVVTLEQQGALRIHPKQNAMLSFDSIRNQTFHGVVKAVYSYNGSFLARIDVDSLPEKSCRT